MNHIALHIALWLLPVTVWGQEAPAYRLYLNDKEGSEMCMLSERALARRERQGIVLDSTDLSVSPTYLNQLRSEGWHIVTQSRWLNTVVVQRADGAEADESSLSSLPFVSHWQQVCGWSEGTETAAAPLRKDAGQTAAIQTGDDFRQPVIELHGDALFEAGHRGQGMLIAVLDGGFRNLPDIGHMMGKVEGWHDCYNPDDVTGSNLWTASEHGTQVLSLMACDSAYGVWGTAPDASYYLIRTEYADSETPLEEDMWVRGAEIADSIGADLINSSLGYATFDHSEASHTWDELMTGHAVVSEGAQAACRKGLVVCNAAGNERQRSWQKLNFPADVEEVFTVGGTTYNLQPSSFSSTGWTAPYVKPDVCGRGTAAWIISAADGQPCTSNGTSYSTPLLCGLMASLWSAAPSLLPEQLRQLVRESASLCTHPDSLMGYGLPNFQLALLNTGCSDLGGPAGNRESGGRSDRVFGIAGTRESADRRGLLIRGGQVVLIR